MGPQLCRVRQATIATPHFDTCGTCRGECSIRALLPVCQLLAALHAPDTLTTSRVKNADWTRQIVLRQLGSAVKGSNSIRIHV